MIESARSRSAFAAACCSGVIVLLQVALCFFQWVRWHTGPQYGVVTQRLQCKTARLPQTVQGADVDADADMENIKYKVINFENYNQFYPPRHLLKIHSSTYVYYVKSPAVMDISSYIAPT